MKLIIAEKPSLARNIVSAIGSSKFKREDGYFESSQYIVTFGFGHLFGLLDLEEYKPKAEQNEKTGWTLDGLPFRPHEFKFGLRKDPKSHKVDSGARKQFNTIKKLCARPDVECVINAGDADREGEIIVRIILEQAGNKKPVMRLWMPDQSAETIQSELRNLRNDSDYDALANEGYARTYIDWLYGINLTRLATLKSGSLLRVGRVIIPIVKAIYDRDMEIRNFVSKKYLALSSKEQTNGEVIELTSKKTFELTQRNDANALAEAYNQVGAVVSSIDTKETTLQPGKLYSLSKLQGVLGKRFKMSPKESLAIIQTLYEAGYVTYPRTNSEYLATAERDKINSILSRLQAKGYKVCPKDKKKSIYDDSKIESHSALTPTTKLAAREDLKENEWKVYSTILNRFLAVFCSEDCTVNRTTIQIKVGDLETFNLKGDVILTRGFLQYDDTGKSDKILPKLQVGDRVNINFRMVEKETQPPKHYTVDALNKYLKNPFRKEKQAIEAEDEEQAEIPSDAVSGSETDTSDDEEYKAIFEGVEIGTEATRTGIIETAIHSNYISLKNNVYTILPGGEFLIQSLQKLQIDMNKEKTAELGRVLKKVYRNEISVEESVTIAFREVRECFTASSDITIDPQAGLGGDQKRIGECPKCGGDLLEKDKFFGCTNKDCRFAIWKDNKLMASLGVKMSASVVKALLKDGQVLIKNCKSAKTGKTFACIIHADFKGAYPQFRPELPDAEELSLGSCPKCGAPVVEREKAFGCSNRECSFVIFKDDKFFASIGRKPNAAIVKSLLNKRKVNLKDCVSSKSGKTFSCCVTVDYNGPRPNYKMDFLPGPKKK